MQIDDFLHKTSEWLKGTGPDFNVVISTRIRLARNISSIPFVHWASKKQKEQIITMTQEAIENSKYMKNALYLRMSHLTDLERQFLVERHLMSPEHAIDPEHKALAVEDREIVSVMINEEDHLRIQIIQSGFNLREAWDLADKIDTDLNSQLEYAYSIKWGYLTACPTNTGTGMRASLLMHLPALVMTKQISKALQALTKLGFAVRGLYGEGTEALGNFFQISNQVTLGRPEEDIIDNFERVMAQVISRENSARKLLLSKEKEGISDKIWRAFGTLKSARIITSNETINLLSSIRLGVYLDVLPHIDIGLLNELFLLIQPAHLQKMAGRTLTPDQRDIIRADLVRKKLSF